MKSLLTLIVGLLSGSILFGQTYLSKDFDDLSVVSGGWDTIAVTGAPFQWGTFTWSGQKFARMSNYSGGNFVSEAWLISPAMNLSGATTPFLSFISAYHFAGDPLQVLISTNYVGGAPSGATWTPLTATWPSTNNYTWEASGNIDLSSYLTTGVYIAFKYTGTASNGRTWEVDDILINESGAVVPPHVPIYDIQYTTGTDSPWKDSTVITGGIVGHTYTDGYFIADGSAAWEGIYVYDNVSAPSIGDSVSFYAQVDEFNGLTELKSISMFTVAATGQTPYPALILTTGVVAAEKYEGVLVTVKNVNCTAGLDGFMEWKVDDGSGVLVIDNWLYQYPNPVIGTRYDVTGYVNDFFGTLKLAPRAFSDVSIATGIEESSNRSQITFYPNPANTHVTISFGNEIAREPVTVELTDAAGAMVEYQTASLGNATQVDLTRVPSGIYLLRATQGTNTHVEKLVKY